MSGAREELGERASALAPRLLGARLSSGSGPERVAVRLSEVEAYEGADDPASHAFRGPTPRNDVMFGPPGHLYVYFVYGMHWCANLVCGPQGTASALLLRAGEVVEGLAIARARRPAARRDVDLARGPARLAQCLNLSRADNGIDLLDKSARVRLELAPSQVRPAEVSPPGMRPAELRAARVSPSQPSPAEPSPAGHGRAVDVLTGPRVGVAAAVEVPLRFWIAGDPTVSDYRPGGRKRVAGSGQT